MNFGSRSIYRDSPNAPLEYDPAEATDDYGDDDQLNVKRCHESEWPYQTDAHWISGGSHMLMYDAGAKAFSLDRISVKAGTKPMR